MFRPLSHHETFEHLQDSVHLSITLMYINSQNTAVRSSISYYSFRYFIVVSFRRHVSAHGPSSGLQIY